MRRPFLLLLLSIILAPAYALLISPVNVQPAEGIRVDLTRPLNSCFEVKGLAFSFSATSITSVTIMVFNRCNSPQTANVLITWYLGDGSSLQTYMTVQVPKKGTNAGSAALSNPIPFASLIKVVVNVQN